MPTKRKWTKLYTDVIQIHG